MMRKDLEIGNCFIYTQHMELGTSKALSYYRDLCWQEEAGQWGVADAALMDEEVQLVADPSNGIVVEEMKLVYFGD
jgi:hypothetical protein